jgi:hypothetical protein
MVEFKNEIKESTSTYGGYIITGLIIFTAFFLYLYSAQISVWWSTASGNSPEYKLINKQLDFTQDYNTRLTIGELTNNTKLLTMSDTGRAITIKCDLHVLNTISNEGWASSFYTLKPIIKIGESPCLYFSPKDSKLIVMTKYKDNPYYPHLMNITVDFPLQKWTSIIVNINNRDVRIYLDNVLVKFNKLDNTAIISNSYSDIISIGEKNNNIQGSIRNLSLLFSDTRGAQ